MRSVIPAFAGMTKLKGAPFGSKPDTRPASIDVNIRALPPLKAEGVSFMNIDRPSTNESTLLRKRKYEEMTPPLSMGGRPDSLPRWIG